MATGQRFDVAVIGGGPAGLCAALQAARAGARTLLVEKAAQLGGTTTTAGVNGIQTFFAYGRQIIAGIGWELVCRTYETLGLPEPTGEKFDENNGVTTTVVDRAIYAAVADEAVLEANIELALHTLLGRVEPDGGSWRLTLCGKEGLREVRALVVIDCTGDANAVRLAGFEVNHHRVRQPGTLVLELTGYDPAILDYAVIQEAARRAIEAGQLRASDLGWHRGSVEPILKGRGGNCIHVTGAEASDSRGRTATELEARRVMLRLVRFFRGQPGLENLTVQWFAPEAGVRETVTIRGRSTISVADYMGGRRWPDAVSHSFYPIDVHTDDGLDYRPLARGVVPTIPLGAMLPQGARNLIVAGRCVSGDRLAFSAYRVQASCMGMGQAAGAAAALAAGNAIDVGDVPVADIRALLATHDAIVPA